MAFNPCATSQYGFLGELNNDNRSEPLQDREEARYLIVQLSETVNIAACMLESYQCASILCFNTNAFTNGPLPIYPTTCAKLASTYDALTVLPLHNVFVAQIGSHKTLLDAAMSFGPLLSPDAAGPLSKPVLQGSQGTIMVNVPTDAELRFLNSVSEKLIEMKLGLAGYRGWTSVLRDVRMFLGLPPEIEI
ncbi:uncharacterized protein LTR77_006070 [Saxophila tyrrhenica]|uniref:Uncharacterized protein n=1 Tax=Saxophila tyrrhenica TaxID=1690608 RepID=A0AAV9P734_9PEZI|nr:hypothetical protein LTR77_006070 [Saxophila tyrrhenica]